MQSSSRGQISAVSLATTVIALRAPGMSLLRTPFYAWSVAVAAIMWLLTLPVLVAQLVLMYVDHTHASASFGGGDVFFGFFGSVKDPKIAELAASCDTVAQPAAQPRMTRYGDTDIRGGDLTQKGIRGISLETCEKICLEASDCAGVSYVTAKQWCWPKTSNGVVVPTLGVVTSLR